MSGAITLVSGLSRRSVFLAGGRFLGRMREGRGMHRHDRGNACILRGVGRRSGLVGSAAVGYALILGRVLGVGDGFFSRFCGGRHGRVDSGGRGHGVFGKRRGFFGDGTLRGRGRLVRGDTSRRSGGLGCAEGAAHEGSDALVGRVGGENDGEMRDGFAAPPLSDQEFREMLAQGVIVGPLFDDRHEGVNDGIRHAHKPTGWQARRCTRGLTGESERSGQDPAQRLAGTPRVQEAHRERQGDESGQECGFGGDRDTPDGEESDKPREAHACAGRQDGPVTPGSAQGCVRVGENHEVFVAIPFLVPPARHDDEGGE